MKIEPVETVGWDGDALEAQAFAYLAVRALGRPAAEPAGHDRGGGADARRRDRAAVKQNRGETLR